MRADVIHHFVAQPEDLAAVLEAEGQRLIGTVSHDATMTFTMPEGVELLDVVDRAHERHDDGVTVSLGAFGPGQLKTCSGCARGPESSDHESW